jgi:hypothetical protein
MSLIGYLHDNLSHDLHYSLQSSVEQELSMTLIGYLHDNLIHDLHYSLQYESNVNHGSNCHGDNLSKS